MKQKTTDTASQPDTPNSAVSTGSKVVVLLTCALLDGGCSPVRSALREPSTGEDCPPGALAAKEELAIGKVINGEDLGREAVFCPPDLRCGELRPVQDGAPTSQWVVPGGGPGLLPPNTVFTGRFVFGRDRRGRERTFGRFTQATTPEGRTYPVCLQMYRPGNDEPSGIGQPVIREDPTGPRMVPGNLRLVWVDRFEY